MDNSYLALAFAVAIILVIAIIFVTKKQIDERAEEAEVEYEKTLEQINEERKRQANEFRKIYGLSQEVTVYYESGLYSTSPTQPTDHEKQIIDDLIGSGFFNKYFVFSDCYFKTKGGGTGQIDVIAVSKRGVFVFESKDYSGWIFGNGKSAQWTQSFVNRKFHFYNPIKQNNHHVRILQSIIGIKPKYYSIVVFGENATLKEISYVPKNTYVATSNRLLEVISDILGSEEERLTSAEVVEICKKINSKRLFCSADVADRHVKYIKDDIIGENRMYK